MDKQTANFSMDDFSAADTADMTIVINGKITNWVWTFAGPGHEKAINQSNRMARERLHISRQQEQAQVNGRKWKAPEETPDELRRRNVENVTERLIDWSPIKIDGKDYPFTKENAVALMIDHRRTSLLTQALEFLSDENAFTRRSGSD